MRGKLDDAGNYHCELQYKASYLIKQSKVSHMQIPSLFWKSRQWVVRSRVFPGNATVKSSDLVGQMYYLVIPSEVHHLPMDCIMIGWSQASQIGGYVTSEGKAAVVMPNFTHLSLATHDYIRGRWSIKHEGNAVISLTTEAKMTCMHSLGCMLLWG